MWFNISKNSPDSGEESQRTGGDGMDYENVLNQPASKDNEEKLHRREVALKLGKFVAYTAPALIALATAKDACAE